MNRNSRYRAYMTPNEVAELLMVSPVTLRQWAQKGWIHAITTAGGHRRFLLSDVEKFARDRGMELASDGPVRVLVVDDNRSFARYLADLLSSQTVPIEVDVAHDGFDTGRKVLQFSPDVVLLDLKMPGMDGFSVCEQLKSDVATRDIRIIAMTGYYTPANEERILQAGAEACLAKPFDKTALFSLLELNKDLNENIIESDTTVIIDNLDQRAV